MILLARDPTRRLTCERLLIALCVAAQVSYPAAAQVTGGRLEASSAASELMGPAAPDVLRRRLRMSPEQTAAYSTAYRRYMAETRVPRDTALAAVAERRRGDTQGRARAEGMENKQSARELTARLSRLDRLFEQQHLMPLLTEEQAHAHRQWKKEELRSLMRQRARPPQRGKPDAK